MMETTTPVEVPSRLTSILSVLGSVFIIATFLLFPFFRKPINRLVFFASFGNLLANIATILSTYPIPAEGEGLNTLCEFQGVLIQWFLMGDALWVFCMAANVYLVFFRGYDANQLRLLEKWYMLFSYGISGLPSLIYVILDHTGNEVIGNANLWCWVGGGKNDWMRIAFFYGPVWLFISATVAIYTITSISIFKKRVLLKEFTNLGAQQRQGSVVVAQQHEQLEQDQHQDHQYQHQHRGHPDITPIPNTAPETNASPTTTSPITAKREIIITDLIDVSVATQASTLGIVPSNPDSDRESISSYSSNRVMKETSPVVRVAPPIGLLGRRATKGGRSVRDGVRDEDGSRDGGANRSGNVNGEEKRYGHAATAFSPAVAWPQSAADIISPSPAPPSSYLQHPPHSHQPDHHHSQTHYSQAVYTENNDAAMAYLKVASLMFLALILVWVPSTVNRVYQFAAKDKSSRALSIASAFVLPLQGVCNAVIYTYTTRGECGRAWERGLGRVPGRGGRGGMERKGERMGERMELKGMKELRVSQAEVA